MREKLYIRGKVEDENGIPYCGISVLVEAWFPYVYINSRGVCKYRGDKRKFIYTVCKTDSKGYFYFIIKERKLCYKVVPIYNQIKS